MAQTLNHSPADVLRWALIALGEGTDPSSASSWPIYCAEEPSAPDNCITIYDTQGTDDGRTMNDGEIQQHSGFQVRLRSTTHTVGYLKADAIWTALSKSIRKMRVTIGFSSYLLWSANKMGDILPIGKESPT